MSAGAQLVGNAVLLADGASFNDGPAVRQAENDGATVCGKEGGHPREENPLSPGGLWKMVAPCSVLISPSGKVVKT